MLFHFRCKWRKEFWESAKQNWRLEVKRRRPEEPFFFGLRFWLVVVVHWKQMKWSIQNYLLQGKSLLRLTAQLTKVAKLQGYKIFKSCQVWKHCIKENSFERHLTLLNNRESTKKNCLDLSLVPCLWKLTFSSFKNAIFQNFVDLVFWKKSQNLPFWRHFN